MIISTLTTEKKIVVGIGEMKIISKPGHVVCYGLGSCVAVFLFSSASPVCAAAHVMLPGRCANEGVESMSYSYQAIKRMCYAMRQAGCHYQNIQAKLAGGANLVPGMQMNIGQENINSVEYELARYNIKISGRDTGGTISRTVRFNTRTKEVECHSAFGPNYCIKF